MRHASSSTIGFLGVTLTSVLLACGGATPNTTATSTPPPPPPGGGVVADAKGPDLSSVSKPASVVLVARLNDFAASVDAVDQIVKLPESLRSLVDQAKAKKDMDVFPAHASFDFALAIDSTSREEKPRFLWAVSIPLKSVDEAVAKAGKDGGEMRPTTPGAYRYTKKSDDMTCDVTPAVGDAPARAICSERADSLTELTPWMSRGLAAEPKRPGDLWIHADLAPLKERFVPMLKQKTDGTLAEIKNALTRELNVSDPDLVDAPAVIAREVFAFVDDSDSVDLSFAIDPKKPELRLTGGMQFRAKSSWLTQVLASSMDRPEGAPEMFGRLPKDATMATWGRTSDPALFKGIRKIVHKSVETAFAMKGADKLVDPLDQRAIIGWLDTMPSVSGVWVSASGPLPMKPSPDKDLTAQQAVDEAKSMLNVYLPWAISGGEGDPAAFIGWLKSTEDVITRASADLKKVAGKDAKSLTWLPTAKFTQNPAGFPKGSATLDVTVAFTSKDVWHLVSHGGKPHPAGAEARGSVSLRFAVVPDEAGHFWWGYSSDPEALRAHLAVVQKGAPASGTIASRTDLDTLKGQKGFGGFFNTSALIGAVRNKGDLPKDARKDLDDVLAQLPHKGEDDVFFFRDASVQGGALALGFDVVASKEAVEDLASAVRYGYRVVKEEGKPSAPTPPANPGRPSPPPQQPKKK